MKKSSFSKITLLFTLLIIFSACDKYEQGSKFTLLTAKSRLVNSWSSSSYFVDQGGGNISTDKMSLKIKRDGTYVAQGTFLGIGNSSIGTWEFNTDRTKVKFNYNGVITSWKIIKLKNKELTLSVVEDILGIETTTTIAYEAD